MKLQYICVDNRLKADINFLHDRAAQRQLAAEKVPGFEFFELVNVYKYDIPRPNKCPRCGTSITDDNFNYCPECGENLNPPILADEKIESVKNQYQAYFNRKMTPAEAEKITASYYLKVIIPETKGEK